MQMNQRDVARKQPHLRFIIMLLIVVAAFSAILVELAELQLKEGDAYAAAADENRTQKISVAGTRGKILDANGIPLAYDKQSYNVQFVRDPAKRTGEYNAIYTEALRKTIRIVEDGGAKTITSFAIARNEEGVLDFAWKAYLNEEEAEAREVNWRKNMYASASDEEYETPENIYHSLRARYRIPEDVEEEEALKLLSIWQEAQLSSYMSYIPITIATDVSMETVAIIETHLDLPGVSIEEASVRVYPKGDLAAHTVGYVGFINDQTRDYYEGQGYMLNDTVGVAGIEEAMEHELTGASGEHRGSRTVELNNLSKITRELAYEPPLNGNNVVLTIDSSMQKLAADSLKRTIKEINETQREMVRASQGYYDNLVAERAGLDIRYAETGAVVVMEAKTGRILASVSYPSYDLNQFVGGISHEDYAVLMDEKNNKPLFDRAIAQKAAPGSVFKMATAVAALMEGKFTIDEPIYDNYKYAEHGIPYNQAPACWTSHGWIQNVSDALSQSCNYYFYEAAYRVGYEDLNKWSDTLGITSKTGVEIGGEATGQVSNPSVVYNAETGLDDQLTSVPYYIAKVIMNYINEISKEVGVEYTEEEMTPAIEYIFERYVHYEEAGYDAVDHALTQILGMPETVVYNNNMSATIVPYLDELRWRDIDTITTGIGQSKTAVTPIAMARYTAALINGGKVLEAQMVKQVVDDEGNILYEKEPVVVNEIGVKEEYLAAIKEGMRQAAQSPNGGSAYYNIYSYGLEYQFDMGAKTGTAQVSDINVEDNAWFIGFAPYDDPEIVVVSFVANGLGMGRSFRPAVEIIEYYMDQKKPAEAEKIDDEGTLIAN